LNLSNPCDDRPTGLRRLKRIENIENIENIDKSTAIAVLGALAQGTRLDIFRYLAQIGSGDVDIHQPSSNSHLDRLSPDDGRSV
jgi:hypothetical protein